MILNRPQSAMNLKSISQITSPPKAVDNVFNFFHPSLSQQEIIKKVTISPLPPKIKTIQQQSSPVQGQLKDEKRLSGQERIKSFLTRVQSAKILKEISKPKEEDHNVDKVINQKGRTMLMEAVISGNIDGANPNLTDWKGYNSIIHAIKKNFNDILGVILDSCTKQINLNNRFFTNKVTYLMMAAKLSQSDMVKTLLTAKADPNIRDEGNRTAIFFSIFNNDLESIYDLTEGGTNLTIIDDVIILNLEWMKKENLCRLCLLKELNIIDQLFILEGRCVSRQHSAQIILNEINHQIQQMINKIDHKIMFFAVQNNNLNLVYEMIKRGNSPMSVDEDGNNLMLLAIKHQYYDSAIELCQDYSLNQLITQNNKLGENCIFLSIKEQAYWLAKFFIRNAKSLDCVDNEGKTPLIYAAESNQNDLVELIMKKEAQDINRQDKKLGTALIYAAKTDNVLSVEHILRCRQTVKAYFVDVYGNKARHYCTNKTVKKIINRYMIDQGQLSESLLREMEEEEDQLNKQIIFKIKSRPQLDGQDYKFKKVKMYQQQQS